jgi:translation initiation factor IF-1
MVAYRTQHTVVLVCNEYIPARCAGGVVVRILGNDRASVDLSNTADAATVIERVEVHYARIHQGEA